MKKLKFDDVDFDIDGVIATNEGEDEYNMLQIPFPKVFKYIEEQKKLGRKITDITREEVIENLINKK